MAKTTTKPVTVWFTIKETVSTQVEATVNLPASIDPDDWTELHNWLDDNKDAWDEHVDPSARDVEETEVWEVDDVEYEGDDETE
jgi:hypothetical protein